MNKKNYLKCDSKLKYLTFLFFYIFLYIPAFLLYHRKNYWLICERGIDAQDNGYVFYNFLKKNHKSLKTFYLLSKGSPDASKIDPNDIVEFGSIKHFMLAIGCKVQISSHLFGYCPWPNFMLYLRKHRTKNLHVFLQHGITYNNQYGFYKKVCKALDIYICGSEFEHQFVCSTFGYSEDQAVLTGFARFDNLHTGIKEKSLLIMPTWRRYLTKIDKDDFVNSSYYKHWHSLLNNQALKELCTKNNLKPMFYLHSSLQPFSKEFDDLDNVVVIKYGDETVQNLLKETAILITDYSSVFFDCLYMNKKILLYQFDKDDFQKGHYEEGYFDKLDKTFVPSETMESGIIEKLQKLLDGKNKIRSLKLKNYSDDFFGIKDQKNCERIFETIMTKL